MRNQIEVDNIGDAMDFISLHIRNGYTVSAARVPYNLPIFEDRTFKLNISEKYLIVADKEDKNGDAISDNGNAAKIRKFEFSGGI